MEEIDQRDNKIVTWLKENWILTAILIIALVLRLFFFQATVMQGQTSWWDSAEYLSIGLHYSDGTPYMVSPIRPPLFQYMLAGLISAGATEWFMILLLTLLPSVFVIYCIYLLVKEILGKRAGLISAFFAAVSWNFIFWSNRAQPDFISLAVQVLAIYFFWKMMAVKDDPPEDSTWDSEKLGTAKKLRTKYAMIAAAYAAFGFYFKISALLIPLGLAIFVLIKDRLSAFAKKEYWIYLVTYIGCFIPYMVWAWISFKNILPILVPYSDQIIRDTAYGWGTLAFFNIFGLQWMFWIFLVGMIATLKVFLYLDIIAKDKEKAFDYRILVITFILLMLAFFVFYIRAIEDRWIFLLLPFMCLVCASILESLCKFFDGKDLRWVGVVIVIGLLMGTAYEQVTYGKILLDQKKGSYMEVKQAAEWMASNSRTSDIIMSISYPQTVWYSKRHVETYSTMDVTTFEEYLNEHHPLYVTVSVFEPHPQWIYEWTLDSNNAVPVNAYYQDVAQTQPTLIIYQLQY